MVLKLGAAFWADLEFRGAASLRFLQGCAVCDESLRLDPFLARPLSCLVPFSGRIPVGL